MSGGIDDIYLHVFPGHRTVLCGDRDAALAFKVHIVHYPFVYDLPGAEQAALPEHGVHERGLAMIHVGDYGYIPDTLILNHSAHKTAPNIDRSLTRCAWRKHRSISRGAE